MTTIFKPIVFAVVVSLVASRSVNAAAIDIPGTVEAIESVENAPSRAALTMAMDAYQRAVSLGKVLKPALLTLIDYTRPSTEPRLWVLDLVSGRILHRELVAHGKNSGGNVPTRFSNDDGSLQSSLGLFVTDRTYTGENGYSLRLRGLDAGVNDHAFARAIVFHGADYVSADVAAKLGRLGRSWGCPALRPEIARTIIDLIKDGTVVYAFGR